MKNPTFHDLPALIADLKAELLVIRHAPLVPQSVKVACELTYTILEVLAERASRGHT